MDLLDGLLTGPRAQGAFVLRSVLDPPWALRVEDEAPLTVVAVVRGSAVLRHDDGAALLIASGDVLVVRGPDHYVIADEASTEPQVIIDPGQVCRDLVGNALAERMSLGVRTWGNSRAGVDGAPDSAVLLTGTYQRLGEVGRRLSEVLPRVLRLPADNQVVDLLNREITRDTPGQAAVLDRLLDLLLITTLRSWFEHGTDRAPGWFTAHVDPVVGPAMRLLQHNPQHQWTVASLAAEVGVARATLAKRFGELVGQPPFAFLTTCRLALAADLLHEDESTVARIARQVGYGSPFTFSTAFKREYGVSPLYYRRRARDLDVVPVD